jgi:hypothetical protein
MSPFRLASLTCLASLFLAAADARPQPATPATAPTPVKRTPAEELLDRCLDNLAKLRWMETTFKHTVNGKGIPYQAEGRHIVAFPEKKVCYESRVRLGNATGLMRIQCDGETIWRTVHNGELKNHTTYSLKDLQDAREKIDRNNLGPEKSAQLLRDDDSEHGFLGIQPALLELKEKVTFPKLGSGMLPSGKPVHVLEGEWTKAYLDKLAPQKKEGVSGVDRREAWTKRQGFLRVPRTCKLYLGPDNLWPYRIEWYGPLAQEGKDELLTSIEFSEPVLDKPSAGIDPEKIFRPSEAEQKAAQIMDASLFIKTRENNLIQLQRQEDQASGSKSLLEPTTPKKP